MENRELATVEQKQEWTKEQIDAIRNTVAVGANNSELIMFLSLAKKYDLDPFAKEIWCVQMGGKMTIIAGRDGYLKIANCHPEFNGMESDVVCANDKFFKDKDGVHHSYAVNNRGAIIGAYAIVYRKDRSHPVYVFAPYREYVKNSPVWRQYPSAMNLKVAESMALKRAFSISGIVTQEEIGEVETEVEDKQSQSSTVKSKRQATQETQEAVVMPPYEILSDNSHKHRLSELWNRYVKVCGNPEHAKNAMKKVTGKENSKDFTDEDLEKLTEDVIRREFDAETVDEFFDTEEKAEEAEQQQEVTTQENIA